MEAETQIMDLVETLQSRHLLQLPYTGLHRPGLGGLGPKPLDEPLLLTTIPFLIHSRLFMDLLLLANLLEDLVGGTFHLAQLATMNRHGMGRHLVHELPIVGNQDHLATPGT